VVDRKFIDNQTIIRQQLVPYVYNNPKKYILYYGRTPRYHNAEYIEIDTRDHDTVIPNNNTLQDMDNRNDDQRREDELTLREAKTLMGELRGEIKYLREKNDDLREKIEELRDKLEDEEEGNSHAQMADATTNTIGQVAQLIPTLLDKYFAIQEQKNALMAEQIRRQAPPRPQPTNQTFEQTTNGFDYEE
jgi:hypothetical protein